VAQQAWIQSGTIQENILFGLPMNNLKYQRTVSKCALRTDFDQMELGDQTEIGERGLNLSGGQKQRIQLARALYQDSDVYLLDDVFSAVDAHTGSDLFRVSSFLYSFRSLRFPAQNANFLLRILKGNIYKLMCTQEP
jgi:ATP-binding cassette subfamily C (CFTR/MRP) protein 2